MASLYVPQWGNMPSILVESGFITNASDRAFLTSLSGRQRFAAGVVTGIKAWVGSRAVRPVWPRVGATSLAGTSVAWSKRLPTVLHGQVVVTASRSPLDTLVAMSFARWLSAPILYADPGSIDAAVKAELTRLSPRAVYVIGSESSVASSAVAQIVVASKCPTASVHRIAGTDSYGTAARVAQLMPRPASRQVCVVSAEAPLDGLALATWAARRRMPVLLVRRSGIPPDTAAYLKSRGITSTLVGASSTVIPDSVINRLPGRRRIAGSNRYASCTRVLDVLFPHQATYPLLLACDTPADALIGAYGAVRSARPLMLTGRKVLPDVTRLWAQNHAGLSYLVSGPITSLYPVVEADLIKAAKTRTTSTLSVSRAAPVPGSVTMSSISPNAAGVLAPESKGVVSVTSTPPSLRNDPQVASEEPGH